MKVAALILLSVGSCGDLIPGERITAHCDLRVGMDPVGYCQEWRGLLSAPGSNITAIGVCEALGTSYVETSCVDEEHIVAGCYIGELGDGSESYWWFYDVDEDGNEVDVEDVRRECESGGDDFVEWTPTEF